MGRTTRSARNVVDATIQHRQALIHRLWIEVIPSRVLIS